MVGLALEGGGARGAFHMGAVKALLEEGYEFNGIAGTSIGAINGAIIAQGDFEAGYKLWETMDNSLLFDIEEAQVQKILDRKIDRSAIVYLTAKIREVIDNKGVDTSKIRTVLESIIDEEKLRRSDIDLGIVTVSVTDLKPLELFKEDIPQGKIIDYLMASANFPVFKIEPIDGKFYIDGAFYDNCPVNLLAGRGYTKVVAIRTLGPGKLRKVEGDNVEVTTVLPSENLGRILNFDSDIIQTNLKMGYFDTLRVTRKLIGKKYYVEPVDKELFFHILAAVPEETVLAIREILGLPEMDRRRLLFEHILPELSRLIELPHTASYQDIVIGLLEGVAEDHGIDRFKVRTLNGFVEEIKGMEQRQHSQQGEDAKLKSLLNTIFSSETVLRQAANELLDAFRPEQFA